MSREVAISIQNLTTYVSPPPPAADCDGPDCIAMENINAERTSDLKRDSLTPQPSIATPGYRVYHWRWLLLAALCVMSISNGTMWLTFSPIPTLSASFYHISVTDVDWFSNSYFAASLFIGFISIWVLDIFQLRVAITIGAVLNFTGAIIRYISTISPIICSSQFPQAGFGLAMLGQVLTACAQPFFLYAPTKLANTWFKPNERSICTGITSLANPLGIAVTQVLAPQVVKSTADLPTLLWILIIPAGIGGLLSLCYIRSKPDIPPAPSGDIEQEPFLKGIWKTVKNVNFLLLLVVWGTAAGSVNALLIIVPQYLCPYGYSNEDVGIWTALLIVFGLLGAFLAGLITDRTKMFKEVGVVAYSLAILCIIVFLNIASYTDLPIPIAITLCLFGFFGFSMLPICLELGVEVTYPVAEAISSGLLWSVAQIMGMVILLLSSSLLAIDIPPVNGYNQCGVRHLSINSTTCQGETLSPNFDTENGPQDWTYSGLLLLLMTLIGYLTFTLFFRADCKRVEFEKKKAEEAAIYQESTR